MSAQPHDRALYRDPTAQTASQRRKTWFRISPYLFQQQRQATHDTWSALDCIHAGVAVPAQVRELSAPAGAVRAWRLSDLPRRFIGHAVVLGVVLTVVLLGGLPGLALGMDWTQGATVATDHLIGPMDLEDLAAAQPPVVLANAAAVLDAARAKSEKNDSLQPSTQIKQPVGGAAFVATYTVGPGETLGEIAQRHGVSALSLLMANELRGGMLGIGQELRIPATSGRPHVVAEGETVESIAAHYGVATTAIRFYAPNNLSSGRSLLPGEEIFIPGAEAMAGGPSESEAAAVGALPLGTVRDDETNLRSGPGTVYDKVTKLNSRTVVALLGQYNDWYKVRANNGQIGWISADLLIVGNGVREHVTTDVEVPPVPTPVPTAAPAIAQAQPAVQAQAAKPAVRVAGRWVWPAAGDLTSGFGYRNYSVGRFHNGIDIANRRGTPIRAARGGTVIAAGWCGGYGYCVKINHGDGFVTEYGHMASHPSVRVGQWVDAGQYLGPMGMTYGKGGYASGVHLHFTVKLNGTAVNPMRYLP